MKKGNVLFAIVLLLGFLMSLALGLSSSILSTTVKIQKAYTRLGALAYAEAGVNRALWEINNADVNFATSGWITDSSLSGGQFKMKVTPCQDDPTNSLCKQITSIGSIPTDANPIAQRTVRIKIVGVQQTTNLSFKFGIQVDQLGVNVGNNAVLKGSVFSYGPISMGSAPNTTIQGAATSYANTQIKSAITGKGKIIGDAFAYTISNQVTVTGTKYTGVIPSAQDMPIKPTDLYGPGGKITSWEAETTGNQLAAQTLNGTNNTLGPAKINGDLILNNGAELKIAGTIWVTGNVVLGQNSKVYLDSKYGTSSGVIIVDHDTDRSNTSFGKITVSNGATISGIDKNNQMTPSYTMLFSSQTYPANLWPNFTPMTVTINNGAVGGVFYTPDGSVSLGNAQARAVVGAGLNIANNGIVNYDNNLANSTFAAGPAGKWSITEWQIMY